MAKLVKHGDSAAIIIENHILDRLQIDLDTLLEIRTEGDKLIISPEKSAAPENKISESLGRINKKHGKTLKKLA